MNVVQSETFLLEKPSSKEFEPLTDEEKAKRLMTVERFNKIERGQDTSFLFGGPIHPVPERQHIREKVTEP